MVKLLSHKILDKRAKPILLVFGGILLVGGLIGFMVGIMTCLAMCGSNAPIGMVRTIIPVHLRVIRWDQVLEHIELCGVVPGTSIGSPCVAPNACSAFPITRTAV